jgi:hypothetical protein
LSSLIFVMLMGAKIRRLIFIFTFC